ncbi:MAG TPA: aminotransferase class I/II-fold pyridoxal phosphate-dependent enzyme [Candidatus Acidoferrales bacterium]|nr:aminotransferase class I/II-fold pyridoxal phosphate-dependent enzyme [Candidatus Acidoferrales bacterium]
MNADRTGYLKRAAVELAAIAGRERYREIRAPVGVDAADFSSNDYLGMSRHPRVLSAFHGATRAGSGGARLLGGAHREHVLLEEELAQWLGRERVLLFSSGYHAALGAIPVLSELTAHVYSDERNHASLIDGCRLSGAPRTVYPHAGIPSRAGSRAGALVVSETIFSMDGDAVDPDALSRALGPMTSCSWTKRTRSASRGPRVRDWRSGWTIRASWCSGPFRRHSACTAASSQALPRSSSFW